MSINYSVNKTSIKKIKLDEADENISSIAKYKKNAFLKFCKESDTKSCRYDEMFKSNSSIETGII